MLASAVLVAVPAISRKRDLPETILADSTIKILLNELSGQLAYQNVALLAAVEPRRAEKDFQGIFPEAEFLAGKLREYGVEEVRLESLNRKPSGYWAGLDAELWMVSPEEKRLSRLAEHPALMARGCDEGRWEGELLYLDERDLSRLDDIDLRGRIVLTPLHISTCVPAFAKGAVGVISSDTVGKPLYDPSGVGFNLRMNKGRVKNKVFGFQIWPRLAEELRVRLFAGEKIVLRAETKTANYPWKSDTLFAAVKGTRPDKKGLLFTAHLFERPMKLGANDNASGCAALAEIARALTVLGRESRLARPERTIYFLMGEEGSSVKAFFNLYPDMIDKIFGVVNMDMVGLDLEADRASFIIESPPWSKATFLDSVVFNAARYVAAGNSERRGQASSAFWIDPPAPIFEKNGSDQPFRFIVSPYVGGSDHSFFIESDSGIPALSLGTWPDLAYHTDRDRPDRCDPTQLKRAAFIGAAAALAVCSGRDEALEAVIRLISADKCGDLRASLERALALPARSTAADVGRLRARARNEVVRAAEVAAAGLASLRELTDGRPGFERYLDLMLKNIDDLKTSSLKELESVLGGLAEIRGEAYDTLPAEAADSSPEASLPSRTGAVKPGEEFPFSSIVEALRKDPAISALLKTTFSRQYLLEMYLAMDGKRSLADLKGLLDSEFEFIGETEFRNAVRLLADAGLFRR